MKSDAVGEELGADQAPVATFLTSSHAGSTATVEDHDVYCALSGPVKTVLRRSSCLTHSRASLDLVTREHAEPRRCTGTAADRIPVQAF